MIYFLRGLFWTGVYLALVLTPMIVLLLAPLPPGNGFWGDLSASLGFAGTAMMGVMFVLTARFRRATTPFGIDVIYYFHRQIALVAVGFILAHPAILLAEDPTLWRLFNPRFTPGHLWSGIISFLALLLLTAASLWRKELNIHYDEWRLWHAVLATLSLASAILHIEGVGYYTRSSFNNFLWILITASWIAILLYVRLVKPFSLMKRPYRVKQVIPERGDAWTLVLSPDGHAGLRFLPGQFAWLTLFHSPFALKEHPFSISSSASLSGEIHFTIKELGDFTRRIKEASPGTVAHLDGPYGAFSIDRAPAPGYVFIAGGIGIAPIMSMIRTLADRKDERPLILIYAYKNWERLTFKEELSDLGKKLNLTSIVVLQEPPTDWQGERGMVTEELLRRHIPEEEVSNGWEYLICGPVPMIQGVEKSLHRLGVPLSRIHSELFDLV